MTPDISIAMGTYNGASFLEKQLDSLKNQTVPPREIVVCDDGSTDTTLAILQTFAKTAPFPVKIIRNDKNLGFADNFLKAASLCEGHLIAFCDQDDIWSAEKLAIASAAFLDDTITLFSHGCQLISASDAPLKNPESVLPTGLYGLQELDPMNAFFGYSCVFRRHLLSLWDSEKRPADLIDNNVLLGHDRWVYFLATATGRVAYDERPLVLYRQHGNNQIGSESFRKKSTFQLLRQVHEKYNTYLHKRTEISCAMANISEKLASQGKAYHPEHLLNTYRSMHQYYETRLGLFKKSRISAVFSILRLNHARFYDLPRRYSNRRAFLEDLVAILIAQRIISTPRNRPLSPKIS